MTTTTEIQFDHAIKAEENLLRPFVDPRRGITDGGVILGLQMTPESVVEHLRTLHPDDTNSVGGKWALCFSGGGIRSASVCLGVLQGLAKESMLSKFHYLSTVSGGGYIGSWFTAWVRRAPQGLPEVESQLAADTAVEPRQLTHLRKYAQYLSPHSGVMSVDTWTIASTYLRNLLISWLMVLPLLAAVTMIVRSAFAGVLACVDLGIRITWDVTGQDVPSTTRVLLASAAPTVLAGATFAAMSAVTAMMSRHPSRTDVSRERWARRSAIILWAGAVWFLVATMVLVLPMVWLWFGSWWRNTIAGTLGSSVLLAAILGKSPKTGKTQEFVKTGLTQWLLNLVPSIAAPIAIAVIMSVVSLLSAWVAVSAWLPGSPQLPASLFHWRDDDYADLHATLGHGWAWAAWAVGLLLLCWIACALVNFNKFTMHAFYRDRLVRTFLGASNANRDEARRGTTDFVESDNLWQHCATRWVMHPDDWQTACDMVTFAENVVDLQAMAPGTVPEQCRRLYDAFQTADFKPLISRACTEFRASSQKTASRQHAAERILWVLNHVVLSKVSAPNTDQPPQTLQTAFEQLIKSAFPEDLRKCRINREAVRDGPLHIVNLTLNASQMSDTGRAQRQAYIFTGSSLHCGSPHLGYRPSTLYGGSARTPSEFFSPETSLPRGISLGTLMAISGAAVSPNQGYHTSAPVAFLLALFNVRLGAWLGNPGPSGETTYRNVSPWIALGPTVLEFFGFTDDRSRYVYLSDGGHFENLAVYSMLQRRCKVIVVVDAGCDPKNECADLGRLVRLARIDLGVKIKFADGGDPLAPLLRAKPDEPTTTYIADVHYPSDDTRNSEVGRLIYIKPRRIASAPVSAGAYGASHLDFPHQSTGDQFFNEDQFEAHRALGEHLVSRK